MMNDLDLRQVICSFDICTEQDYVSSIVILS